MGSLMKKAGLLAAVFVVGFGSSARAAVIDVQVPFSFVVLGRTLPAGEYRIEENEAGPAVLTIHGEKGNKTAMYVMTRPADQPDPSGSKPALKFTLEQKHYRLADVWDSASQGREIPNR